MPNEQRLRGVNGPVTQWQAGPGAEMASRNADRQMAYQQQIDAIKERERMALMNLEVQFQGMQRAQQEAQAGRTFSAEEAQKQRTFQGNENLSSRAIAEREALRQQANADRTFTEGQSQFDRELQGRWAQNQMQATAGGGGTGGHSGGGGGAGAPTGTARQASATAALAFLQNESIMSGRLDDASLGAQLSQLAMLDPEAARLAQKYLTSEVYRKQIREGAKGSMLHGGQEAVNAAMDRLRGLSQITIEGTAQQAPSVDTGFLSRPSVGPVKSDGTLKAERMLGDVHTERSRLMASGMSSERAAAALRKGMSQPQWEQGVRQVPDAPPRADGRMRVGPAGPGIRVPGADWLSMGDDTPEMVERRYQALGRALSPFPGGTIAPNTTSEQAQLQAWTGAAGAQATAPPAPAEPEWWKIVKSQWGKAAGR